MPYDDIVLCPCKKSWVPKGFEHQCPYCKGKKSLPDLWAELCNAKPSWPVDLSTPTNSKPCQWNLAPKKEVVRINLPPKPSALPAFKLSPPKPSSKDSLSTKKDIEDAFDEFFNEPTPAKKKSTEESLDNLYNEMLDRQEGDALRELIDDVVEEDRRKDDLAARETLSDNILKKLCGCCGNERVIIRGRYPQNKKRIVCPTCMAMRLDTIQELTSPNHWQTDVEKR